MKQPLKVHHIPWSYYTLDGGFLVSKVYDLEFQYVYAFSVTKESTKALEEMYFDESLKKKGHYYYQGLRSEELRAVD